ncbi:MAG: CoA transferase, partial [Sphingomonas sp.]
LPTAKAVTLLEAEGVPVAPVRHPEDALVDPRVVARKETLAVAHPSYASQVELRSVGVPIQFSAAHTGFDDVMPVAIGEHNDSIYRDILGYSESRIEALRQSGTI